jgi:hypothetical protein
MNFPSTRIVQEARLTFLEKISLYFIVGQMGNPNKNLGKPNKKTIN